MKIYNIKGFFFTDSESDAKSFALLSMAQRRGQRVGKQLKTGVEGGVVRQFYLFGDKVNEGEKQIDRQVNQSAMEQKLLQGRMKDTVDMAKKELALQKKNNVDKQKK